MRNGNWNSSNSYTELNATTTNFAILFPYSYPPSISHPPDVAYHVGTTEHAITWTITEIHVAATWYEVYRNTATLVTSGAWVTGDPIVVPVNGLAMGSYNYTIIARDGLGNISQDEVWVHVHDLAITSPLDLSFTAGTSGHSISWTVTSSNSGITSYTIYKNGAWVAGGSWTSGVAIVHIIDGLPEGSFDFTCVAADGLGLSVQDEVNVLVIAAPPRITHPADIEYLTGSTGHAITWTITAAHNGTTWYLVYRDTVTLVTSGAWTSGTPIVVPVDGLTEGYYNYSILATDGLGNVTQDDVFVRVRNLNITHPEDITFLAGTTGHFLNWIVMAMYTGTTNYTIYYNTSQAASNTWTSGTSFGLDVSGLAVGWTNVTCKVWDGLGNVTQDEVWVRVGDLAITSPANLNFTAGTIGHTISWAVTASHRGSSSYAIYRNGSWVTGGSWTSGIAITYTVDGLSAGSYNFTCVATDGLGLAVQDEILVLVEAASPNPGETTPGGIDPLLLWGTVGGIAAVGVIAVALVIRNKHKNSSTRPTSITK